MSRLLVILLMVSMVLACSDPRETMLPQNLQQWETDQNFRSSLTKLTLEEQRIISTYLMRVTLEQLQGESVSYNMTIAEAIEEQQIWVGEWQAFRIRLNPLPSNFLVFL